MLLGSDRPAAGAFGGVGGTGRVCVMGGSDWWVSPGRVGGCFPVGIEGRVPPPVSEMRSFLLLCFPQFLHGESTNSTVLERLIDLLLSY